ncbi:ABC transporter [Candidatus Falkowbacteria bacterium HGW-Falkowbacteria-1]|uniref:ABC transporter n=1 Tax=Candidatus Falkowbacteria bacterium HGW-Falkowbacteria-1 TaxID=2013768 RepID=A0A2N2E975_9BACT|nr:MAG: ABC transporter [Candidatus Falkowbacteria bacterium HGW-Falkowbacteria-1]
MSILLQVKDLKKEYSGQIIFSGLSFAVSEKQKIGVVGVNGAGKSTLFRIISGEESSDSGEMIINKKADIGYLKQKDDWFEDESGLEYLIRQADCPDWQAKKMASRFELDDKKLSLLAKELSGGWRIRLRLCGMLIKGPNLLLLDEPSNYLDLNTLILLENYLNSYNGSFLIISHDREFLKNVCSETIEISKNGCYYYPGNIDNYLTFKKQKLATTIKANKNLEKQQEHWQEFVDRFRYKDSKAKQAQALIKKIAKIEKNRVIIERKASISRIIIPAIKNKKNFSLRIDNLSIGYKGKKIVSNIDFICRFGEKLAILGLNGQGKTTLIRTLAGCLEVVEGSFQFARNSSVAYHGQEEMELMNDREQAGDFLRRLASPDIKLESILKMAGDFLFKEEELKKPISVLSGGEKSRLLLAGLLLSRPSILILDEPTCHLDFETTEALGQALKKWDGMVLFASHDRAFSKLVSTGIIEIKDKKAKRLHNDYDDYVNKLKKDLIKKTSEEKNNGNFSEKKHNYLENKLKKKEISLLEKKIIKMEERKKELITYFLKNYSNYDLDKVKELEELEKSLKEKEDLWLALNED